MRTELRTAGTALTWGPGRVGSPGLRWGGNLAAWAGALLTLASALIHLHLWASGGYREIAVIGPLFLAQGIAGIVLAVALAVLRRLWLIVGAAGLLASTAAGLLLSVHVGLFGFRDSLAAPYASASLAEELAGVAVLVLAGLLVLAGRPGREGSRG